MWDFYRKIPQRLPSLFWHSLKIGEGEFGVIFIILYLYDVSTGNALMAWVGLHPGWFLAPVGIIFCHLVMKAIYDQYREMEVGKDDVIERERDRSEKAVRDAIEIGRNGEKSYKELDHNWHKKYVELESKNEVLTNRVKDLETRLEDRDKKKLIASLLGMAVHSGGQLLRQQLASENDVPGWIAQVQAWYLHTNNEIHANMSPADATMFTHVTVQGNIGFSHAKGDSHNGTLNQLNALIENLRGLHHRYA